jgi:hypothetical protein
VISKNGIKRPEPKFVSKFHSVPSENLLLHFVKKSDAPMTPMFITLFSRKKNLLHVPPISTFLILIQQYKQKSYGEVGTT